MWTADRKGRATLALIALASVAGIASFDAQGAVRRGTDARESHHAHPAPAHPIAHRAPSYSHGHPGASFHRETVGRSVVERHLADGSVMRETHLAGGGRVRELSRGPVGGQVHVVRYGNAVSGTVEHTIRPGLMSRTFVSGGHVLYTHVYQGHVWHQFGRSFAYETFVPAVRYPAVYYAWALAPWRRPMSYTWGWRLQPWYATYGLLFTPYAQYSSPDLWMTDYILAQSMQTAYQAQAVPTASQAPALPPASQLSPPSAVPAAPAQDSSVTAPAAQPTYPASAPQASDAPPAPQPASKPIAPVAAPPAITPQVKAQLDQEIKVQLQEHQAAAAMPATLTTQSTPPALRPNHVFFQVVHPLDVPSGTAKHYCSLSPDDYIKRTGGVSQDDWMIPVVVQLSGPSDCPVGLHTRIGLNDLNAMENEQEAQVMEAMEAASKSMGPNGPPSGPGSHPSLIADGRATADPSALDAIRQTQ
jgi:hypothetical protein